MTRKVILVTTGQPSINPRLVKEADALTNVGYSVTVLYAYWNNWATEQDIPLLAKKKWNAVRLGGDPRERPSIYFFSKLFYKINSLFLNKPSLYRYFASTSIARSYFLIKGAKKCEADLYIAHNLGALPAVIKAAKKYGKPCGFDAEDFHRQELSDDVNSNHYKICKYLEDKYLPYVNYITAASPLIAEKYASLYNRKVTTILNVFPKSINVSSTDDKRDPLKLFWFSQTIGKDRGLELIIDAMGISSNLAQLHLLGEISSDYKKHLLLHCEKNGVSADRIYFYKPQGPDDIFGFASQFDIGLASESAVCLNRTICLTNKIFTYIQGGLAVVASNTPAQTQLISKYPDIGKIYSSAEDLSFILNHYHQNRDLLLLVKKEALKVAQNELNWETESQKFITLIETYV